MAPMPNKQRLELARAARLKSGKLGGRPKGSLSPENLEKEREKKALDQFYLRAQRRINQSQVALATGQTFLYRIDKEFVSLGKNSYYKNLPPKLVTSQTELEAYLTDLAEHNGDISDDKDSGAAYYFLTTKEPSNEAIKDILNRVHGKPKETIEQNTTVTFTLRGLHERSGLLAPQPEHRDALDITDTASGALDAASDESHTE